LYRQNAENALQAAGERIKADEIAAKELRVAIEALSKKDTESGTSISVLRREKASLEARLRELEANLQQVVNATSLPGRRGGRGGRPRSSSFTGVPSSQSGHELVELRSAAARHQLDLQKANDKLSQVESQLINATNEKMVLERQLGAELGQMRERLLEKDEEIKLSHVQQKGGLEREREEELLRRVEEEEAKVSAMETLMRASRDNRDIKSVEGALQRAEKRLKSEMARAKQVEERQADLVKEREMALGSLNASQDQVRTLTEALRDKQTRIDYLEAQEK